MEKISKVLRKGATDNSVHQTTHYEKLAQDPSDDEAEDDVVFLQEGTAFHSNGTSSKKSHEAPLLGNNSVEEAVRTGVLLKAIKLPGDKVQVKTARRRFLTRRRMTFFLFLVLALLAGALASVLLAPYLRKAPVRPTAEWMHDFAGFGSESCVRLVDVDGDDVLDVIVSVSVGLNRTDLNNLTRTDIQSICKRRGESYPCLGRLFALHGTDGKILWSTNIHAGLIELSCGKIDVNKDGRLDCIGTGRLGTVVAFDPRNGTILWEVKTEHLVDSWSSFNVLVLSDYSKDGVPELLLAHSSDPRFPAEVTDRVAGRLILINGATGKSMGRYLAVPDNKETYMSPVLHSLKDRSQYIVFGSGGETVQGSLLALSVPDFYRYVMQLGSDSPVAGAAGSYKQWNNIRNLTSSPRILEIHRAKGSGVMVPPVCVDMNGDGVTDMLVLDFEGNLTLFDGQSLKVMWTTTFQHHQSYSSPAPGYFNDDDTLDFMLQLGNGIYPHYDNSTTVIVDGKTGHSLWTWTVNSSKLAFSSPLVIRTTEEHRDVFLFRVVGHQFAANTSSRKIVKRQSEIKSEDDAAPVRGTRRKYTNAQIDRSADPNSFSSYLGGRNGNRDRVPDWSDSQPAYDYGDSLPAESLPAYAYNDDGSDGNSRQALGGKEQDEDLRAPSYSDESRNAPLLSHRRKTVPVLSLPTVQPTKPSAALVEPTREHLAELTVGQFAVDRSLALNPWLIYTDRALALKYNLTADDKKMIKELQASDNSVKVRRHAGMDSSSSSRSAARGDNIDTDLNKQLYTVLGSSEVPTGAIGDVDGDGTLDLVTIVTVTGTITDPWDGFLRVVKRTEVRKINLELNLRDAKDFVSIVAQTREKFDASLEPRISKLNLKSSEEQLWTSYLGSRGDSVYSGH